MKEASSSANYLNNACVSEHLGFIFLGERRYQFYACLKHASGLHKARYFGTISGISSEILNFSQFVSKYCNCCAKMNPHLLLLHVFDPHRTEFEEALQRINWSAPENFVVEYTRRIGFILFPTFKCSIYACPCAMDQSACVMTYLGDMLPLKVGNEEFLKVAKRHVNGAIIKDEDPKEKLILPVQVFRSEEMLFEKAFTMNDGLELKVEFINA